MLNLIRLEMKKYKIGSSIKGALVATGIIFGVILLGLYGSKLDHELAFENYEVAFSAIDTLVRAVFIIFASTLIAKLIIDEYKNKTITILFMYPINRKKIIIAKLILIVIFTFTAIIFANTIITTLFYFFNEKMQYIPDTLSLIVVKKHVLKVLMNALAATGMSLIPLFFGMRKYSVPTTIISSIIIVFIICSNNGGMSLNNIIIIPITLAIIGVLIAYLAIKNIEKVDLIE
ncbi:ABC transporter permease [Neobacillus sp.]|uniref:ABC transporter permease n=1 Tax=Neobacillus sp. TaxID=2675273 RepID=UPI00289C421A|nr:ABC transporter permease [Neobacillus sp.]